MPSSMNGAASTPIVAAGDHPRTRARRAGQTGAQSVQYRSPAGVEYRSLPDTEAVKEAQAALAADPRNVAHIIDLGVAQSGARQFREAIATFTRGSRSSRTTRCCFDGAGIGIFPSVNSIRRWPISRAAHDRQHDLRHLVSPRDRPVRARRICRGGRVVCQGAAHRPGFGRAGGSTDWLWMSLSRAGRGAEAKAMLDRRPEYDSRPSPTPTRVGCSSIAARSARMPCSRLRTPTRFKSRRSPMASATGISSRATRRRRAMVRTIGSAGGRMAGVRIHSVRRKSGAFVEVVRPAASAASSRSDRDANRSSLSSARTPARC